MCEYVKSNLITKMKIMKKIHYVNRKVIFSGFLPQKQLPSNCENHLFKIETISIIIIFVI